MNEKWLKVYFENGTMRVLRNITKQFVETWPHFIMEDGTEAIINPSKVLMYVSKGRKHVK